MEGEHLYLCLRSIHAVPRLLSLLLFDPLQYFSWLVYGGIVIAYSALVFHGELSKADGPLIFSKQNARSLSQIITVHISYLAILLGLMLFAQEIYPFSPNWMTDMFNSRGSSKSALDIMFILAMIGMSYVERRKLYVNSETVITEAKDKSSQLSSANRGEKL